MAIIANAEMISISVQRTLRNFNAGTTAEHQSEENGFPPTAFRGSTQCSFSREGRSELVNSIPHIQTAGSVTKPAESGSFYKRLRKMHFRGA